MNVLIVEDDPLAAEILALIVRRTWTAEVVTRHSAENALGDANCSRFDLILVDWMLPGCTGVEFIRRIRAIEVNRATPILMVTARNEMQDVLEAVEAGANGFVLKPIDPKYLVQQIHNVVPHPALATIR